MRKILKNLSMVVLGSVSIGLLQAAALKAPVDTPDIVLKSELSTPIVAADEAHTTFLKVGLTGFKLDVTAGRTPANVAIVLDRSGSMRGAKLQRAKQAASLAVELLNENDIVSIVAYDSVVEVLVPATRVSDKPAIVAAIEGMRADRSTALFAGVSKGAAEVRKFMDDERVNRVILLSDGQANIGPSSPTELGELGASLGKDGISVTTIGLGEGYNEDLMTTLAGFSDGNHAFVARPDDLVKVFQYEFGDVLSVVAQDVNLVIECAEGVRPLRLLGRDGDIRGQKVTTRFNQLYSEQEKYILLEVEVPKGQAEHKKVVANIALQYRNMSTNAPASHNDQVQIAYSHSVDDVKQAVNATVIKAATKQVSNQVSKRALELRDKGDAAGAQSLLQENVQYIQKQAASLPSMDAEELEAFSEDVQQDAEQIVSEKEWNSNRKALKARQYKLEKQQKY